ncbi:MAG: hypothetical protein JXA77_02850 [Bacteroidales bacterium]|nr:hypothetical protein [Bacteroidales bacterium]MBN2819922.1 hypothetical protein [Bacteroidales bacterium]
MKNLHVLFLVSVMFTSTFFLSCSEKTVEDYTPVHQLSFDTIYFESSMKGWELYSWPNGNDWNYSIVIGTNRLKSYEEVTMNMYMVHGKDSLKLLLERFPKNEQISWVGEAWLERCWGSDYGNLSLPDKNTVNEIKDFCTKINLQLLVGE